MPSMIEGRGVLSWASIVDNAAILQAEKTARLPFVRPHVAEGLVDEHPDAYKDITQVMADQADLCQVQYRLHSVLNFKGAEVK